MDSGDNDQVLLTMDRVNDRGTDKGSESNEFDLLIP